MHTISFEEILRAGCISSAVVFVLFLTARVMGLYSENFFFRLGKVFISGYTGGIEMVGYLVFVLLSALGATFYSVMDQIWRAGPISKGLALLGVQLMAFMLWKAGCKVIPVLKKEQRAGLIRFICSTDFFVIITLHLAYCFLVITFSK